MLRRKSLRFGLHLTMLFPEPFDTASWMLVGIVAIHAATVMILLFEWASPSGFDMKVKPSGGARKLVSFISLLIKDIYMFSASFAHFIILCAQIPW